MLWESHRGHRGIPVRLYRVEADDGTDKAYLELMGLHRSRFWIPALAAFGRVMDAAAHSLAGGVVTSSMLESLHIACGTAEAPSAEQLAQAGDDL